MTREVIGFLVRFLDEKQRQKKRRRLFKDVLVSYSFKYYTQSYSSGNSFRKGLQKMGKPKFQQKLCYSQMVMGMKELVWDDPKRWNLFKGYHVWHIFYFLKKKDLFCFHWHHLGRNRNATANNKVNASSAYVIHSVRSLSSILFFLYSEPFRQFSFDIQLANPASHN